MESEQLQPQQSCTLKQSKNKYLDSKKIVAILKQMVAKERDITCGVKASKSSLSIYFRLYSRDQHVSRRISDHRTASKIKTLIVTPNTKHKHVRAFILCAIQQLKRNRTVAALKGLEGTYAREEIEDMFTLEEVS